MSIEFPTLVYKVPGQHGLPPGYAYRACTDEEQFAALSEEGWHATLAEAQGMTGLLAAAQTLDEQIDDISPPTRAELEQKAQELGIGFNHRTKDETLVRKIAEALGGD